MNAMLKPLIAATLPLGLFISGTVSAAPEPPSEASPSMESIQTVSPALGHYTQNLLLDEVWERDGLSRHDRTLITIAALIARDQAIELPRYINMGLDQEQVSPAEISETITHLAFYSGWANAMSAVAVTSPIFKARGITADQLPASKPEALLPLNEEAEEKRKTFVDGTYGEVSPGVVHYTTEALFRDLWLRPALKPRDRSLITVSALIAAGKVEQVPFHLNKAMDNGLTQGEASEMLTQLAFYAGWPNVFSALPVVKEVLAQRP